jgi:hypothetical protein
MQLDKKFLSNVQKMLSDWERLYRKDIRDNNYLPLHWANVDESLKGKERRDAISYAEAALQTQIDFIRMMVSFGTLSGDSPQTIARIEQFINNQHCSINRLPNKKMPAFSLTFWGGCSSGAVMVQVNHLGQFDFADAWSEEMFDIICVSNFEWKNWTKKRFSDIAQHIREDFAYDGIKLIALMFGYRHDHLYESYKW